MNATSFDWLNRASRLRGVTACAVREKGIPISVRVIRAAVSEKQAEQAVRGIAEMVQGLQRSQLPSERLQWSFEEGVVHCGIRGSGALGVIFVNSDLANPAEIESAISEFLAP